MKGGGKSKCNTFKEFQTIFSFLNGFFFITDILKGNSQIPHTPGSFPDDYSADTGLWALVCI